MTTEGRERRTCPRCGAVGGRVIENFSGDFGYEFTCGSYVPCGKKRIQEEGKCLATQRDALQADREMLHKLIKGLHKGDPYTDKMIEKEVERIDGLQRRVGELESALQEAYEHGHYCADLNTEMYKRWRGLLYPDMAIAKEGESDG